MPARLLVFLAERPAREWLLDEGASYAIGRDAAVDLRVDDERVSRQHARLAGAGAKWQLDDLGSKNGTAVDGVRVERIEICNPCWLSLGGVPARFETLDREARDRLLGQRRDRRQTTQGLPEALDPGAGLEPLLDRLLESLCALVDADRAWVLTAGAGGGLAPVRGRGAEPAAEREFGGSWGAVERALATLHPVVTTDALAHAELAQRGSVAGGTIRALACLPLIRGGHVLGALYADASRPAAAFTELDLELLAALAEHAALALDAFRVAGEIAEVTARAAAGDAP